LVTFVCVKTLFWVQAYAKSDDNSNSYYETKNKTLEVNPRHPIVKSLLARVVEEVGVLGD
jgi:hypothetical protein